MAYLHSKRHSYFGAAGSSAKASSTSASALADSLKAQVKYFVDTVKREADRMFSITRLQRDSDRARAETAKAAALKAQNTLMLGSSGTSAAGAAFFKNPGASKSAMSAALTEIKACFLDLDTGITGTTADTLSTLQTLTALVNSINSAIDQVVKAAADEAAAAAKRSASISSAAASVPSTPFVPPPPMDSGGGSKPPWAVIALAVGAALLLIPSKGK